MNTVTKTIAATFFLALFVTGITAPQLSSSVQAHQREDDGNTSVSSDDSTQSSEPTLKRDNFSDDSLKVQSKINALRAEAKAAVEAKRDKVETLSADKRMKVCENRKTAINNKLKSYTASAEKHLTRLSNVQDKILAYQERKQIVVADNDAVLADITSKKQAATEATLALEQMSVAIDCTDPETATTLHSVRDAAHTTRDALHEYRVSLKNLVTAIAETQLQSTEKKAE